MKLTKKLTALALTLVMGASAFAIDGTEIMTKVYDRQKPDFSKAAVQVVLSKNGKVEETRNVGEYGRCKNNLSDVVMIFLSPASVKELGEAMRRLCENKAERETFGRAAKKRVLDNFSLEVSNKRVYDLFCDIVKERGR